MSPEERSAEEQRRREAGDAPLPDETLELPVFYVEDYLLPGDPPLDRLPHPAVARTIEAVNRVGGGVACLRKGKESVDVPA